MLEMLSKDYSDEEILIFASEDDGEIHFEGYGKADEIMIDIWNGRT